MKAYVFTDKSLERYAGQFVWLAIDTENSKNTAFLAKYPIRVWPSLLVIDPKKESVALKYAGGATVPQLRKLLDDGRRAVMGTGARTASDEAIARADRLANDNKPAEAAVAYREAIAAAPKSWRSLGRAAESLVFSLTMARDNSRCVEEALVLYPRVKGTYSAANVAAVGLGCATELKEDDPRRANAIAALETATRETLEDKSIPLSGDDKSGLYESLVSAREELKDEAGAHALRVQWVALLEAEAGKAKTPEQRAVYDSHRVSAYLALKQPEKLIPMLEQSERDFPKDYNPPSRLSLAYKAMGKYDEALAATERALARAYGPRKIGIYRNRSDIFALKGDKESAKKTLEEAIRYAEALPKEQRSDTVIASMKKKLETM
ncbi:MAG: tetratricopeptide repeat protein [Acidobacteriota bacterium]